MLIVVSRTTYNSTMAAGLVLLARKHNVLGGRLSPYVAYSEIRCYLGKYINKTILVRALATAASLLTILTSDIDTGPL